jgi:hypothetical protein
MGMSEIPYPIFLVASYVYGAIGFLIGSDSGNPYRAWVILSLFPCVIAVTWWNEKKPKAVAPSTPIRTEGA